MVPILKIVPAAWTTGRLWRTVSVSRFPAECRVLTAMTWPTGKELYLRPGSLIRKILSGKYNNSIIEELKDKFRLSQPTKSSMDSC
jgi:hypothetical protein